MMQRFLIFLCVLACCITSAYAQDALPSGYLVASGSQITSGSGVNVRMACVNADNSLPADVINMRSAGFNCLRYSWWDVRLSGSVSTPGSLLAMDAMVAAATAQNMRVIFVHRGNEGSSTDGCLKQQKNGLWYDLNGASPYDQTNNTNGCGTPGTITYATFRTNWITVATRYNGNATVIGLDLHQEPLVPSASWSANNICANCGTDVSGMCSDVGTAVNVANPGALVICEGPLNNGTQYLNGSPLNAVAGNGLTVSDLTMAATSPVTGFPTNKLVYSAHDYPCNVGASCPSSGATNITAKNTAWGYLVSTHVAPVFIGEVGCSCDGSNGSLTDDTNWATAFTQYANGQVQTQGGTGGPTFIGTQRGLSSAWWDWGNQPTSNPNGILLANGSFNQGQGGSFSPGFSSGFAVGASSGQRQFWLTLLYSAPAVSTTTFNPSDKSAGIVLSNGNLTATSPNGAPTAVRSTTSKSSGKFCFAITATTISQDWDVGLSNGSFNLDSPNGLGGDSNGFGFDLNFNLSASSSLGIFTAGSIVSQASDSTGDVNGAEATICEDFSTHLLWVTSPRMRALGNNWNNSATADPASGTGGIDTTGLTCPCFATYSNFEAGAGTLNTLGPFAVSTPTGFLAWDASPVVAGRIIIINLN